MTELCPSGREVSPCFYLKINRKCPNHYKCGICGKTHVLDNIVRRRKKLHWKERENA